MSRVCFACVSLVMMMMVAAMLSSMSIGQSSTPEKPTMQDQIRAGLKPLEPLLGQWKGELIAPARDGQPETRLAITWTNAWSFDGRWFRMEFASTEPRGERGFMEWIGLFTFNPAENRIESVWMSPRIRTREGSFLDGRDIFFEKGAFNAAGNVMTLIAPKQFGQDAPVVEVQSTFTIADADHFVCVDAEKDPATGNWNQSGRFELTRVK